MELYAKPINKSDTDYDVKITKHEIEIQNNF